MNNEKNKNYLNDNFNFKSSDLYDIPTFVEPTTPFNTLAYTTTTTTDLPPDKHRLPRHWELR
jgi:hypothetical protein